MASVTSYYIKCGKCNNSKIKSDENFNTNKHFLLCQDCRDNCKLYSKSFCIKQLQISKKDIKLLKYLLSSEGKFYLDSDIENIIQNKFNNKIKRKLSIENQRLERKKNLQKKLADYKLDYRNIGDCFTYVKYGYPEIEDVIKNEIERYIKLSRRRDILCKELKKYDIPYDERNDSICYNYIHGISEKSLYDIVNDAKIENFYKTQTEYPKIFHLYSDEKAKDIALQNYLNKTEEKNIDQIANQLLENEFILRLD